MSEHTHSHRMMAHGVVDHRICRAWSLSWSVVQIMPNDTCTGNSLVTDQAPPSPSAKAPASLGFRLRRKGPCLPSGGNRSRSLRSPALLSTAHLGCLVALRATACSPPTTRLRRWSHSLRSSALLSPAHLGWLLALRATACSPLLAHFNAIQRLRRPIAARLSRLRRVVGSGLPGQLHSL